MKIGQKIHDAGKVSATELAKLPVVVQVLLQQIEAAPKAERSEIHGRLASYIGDFAQKDVPASAAEALNAKLATLGLPSVSVPPSATVAAFKLLVDRERSVTSLHSTHTGRYEPIDPSHLRARHRAIDALTAEVAKLGASMTKEELSDAARILELAVRVR